MTNKTKHLLIEVIQMALDSKLYFEFNPNQGSFYIEFKDDSITAVLASKRALEVLQEIKEVIKNI